MNTAKCPTCGDDGAVCNYYPVGRKVQWMPNVKVSDAYYHHIGGVQYKTVKAHYEVWCDTCRKKFITDWENGGIKQWYPERRPSTANVTAPIMLEYLLHALSDCLKDSMQLNRPLQIDDWVAIEDKLHKAAQQWWPLRKNNE